VISLQRNGRLRSGENPNRTESKGGVTHYGNTGWTVSYTARTLGYCVTEFTGEPLIKRIVNDGIARAGSGRCGFLLEWIRSVRFLAECRKR